MRSANKKSVTTTGLFIIEPFALNVHLTETKMHKESLVYLLHVSKTKGWLVFIVVGKDT